MLRKLLKFELAFHIKSVGFWLSVFIMLALGLLSSTDWLSISASGGAKVKLNGTLPIALNLSFLSIACIFFGAVFVVNGVLRDDTFKSVEVIHATQVNTTDMILSRMLAAWITVTLCLSAIIITMLAGPFMPWADKEAFGPINLLYYLHPTVIFTAVNALFVTAIFTTIAVLTREKAMVYVSAVGLLILYFAAGALGGDNAPEWYGAMVDPFGATALAEVTQYWPAAEQNSRLAPLNSYVGLNRLIWGGLGLGLFALSFIKSTRGIVTRRPHKNKFADVVETKNIELYPVTPKLGLVHNFKSFGRRLLHEYVTTIRSTPFIIMMGIFIALFGIVLWGSQAANPDPVIPTSTFMASLVLNSLFLPTLIVMVFFGGDIIWREKVVGINEILDATPVGNSSLLWAKWGALTLVIFTMILSGILFGILAQAALSGGRVDVNPLIYFKTGLLAFGVSFTLFAFLVMFIQNFMPNRIVGMLVAATIIISFQLLVSQLPFYHPLMRFGSVSPGNLSEMSGYADLSSFKAFGIYWSAFALILAILSIWLYRRGLQNGLIARIRRIGSSITIPTAALAVLGLAGFIGTGIHIHGAYEDVDYRNKTQREKRLVAYEKLVKPHEDDPQPEITAVTANVQFYPNNRDAVVSGTLSLVNPHDEALEEFYLRSAVVHEEDIRKMQVMGASKVTEGKLAKGLKDYNVNIFRFDTPLAPGATTSVKFETYFHPPKLADGSVVVENGTFVNNNQVMPSIGIPQNYMQNPDTRRKYDLDELEDMPERTDMEARNKNFFDEYSHYVDFKATVCTDADQIGIAPGELLRTYDDDRRSCRDYKAVRPIANFFSFLSGDYVVAKDEWIGPDGTVIPLEIFHYKSHDYNVPLMLEAMKDSFKTFTREYGPYQYTQLRIIEFPYRSFAQSFAGTVPFSENIGFMRDPGDPDDNKSVDLATYVTMHEIGHQWFGHQIMPARTVGFNVLSEGLTENTAMTAYEEELGWQKARRLLEQRAIQTYLISRALDNDDEPPLAKAEGQQYLVYNKASWVFWGLKQYMGEAKMQAAIKKFVTDYGSKGAPYPTTLQLTEYLREAAGPDYDQLITDYWDRITFWNLGFAKDVEPEIKPNPEGGYDVTVQIRLDKLIASEEDGKEVSVGEMDGEGLNEWIEVGLYSSDPKDTFGDEWDALERVRITDANSVAVEGEDETARTYAVTITVDKAPSFVTVDPRRLLIERNVNDNTKPIEGQRAEN